MRPLGNETLQGGNLVLDKAGSCDNYGWVINDTGYCFFSNVKNTISEIHGDSIYGGYDQANFNTSLNKTRKPGWCHMLNQYKL